MDIILLMDVFILTVLFFMSAFFSASETALMGLGRSRLAHAIEQGGSRGHALEYWKSDPNRFLTTILILNNSVNISASTVAAFMAIHISEMLGLPRGQMGTLMAALVTLVIIVFGEVTPKVLAMQNPEKISLLIIRPMVLLAKGLNPASRFLVALANVFLRPFGLKSGSSIPMITEEEIHALIQMGADEGVIEDQEHQMIHGVIRLAETQVREVMIPRTEMDCINAKDNIDRIIDQIVQTGYSRMPVYKENVDHIIGVVYTKDILSLLQNRELILLPDILRQPYFVPETKRVDELLRDFQRGKLHMAIVVDEYGGTSGLVTLEDLMEEIVGDIRDEYDSDEKNIEKVGDKTWLVSAQADIEEINDFLDLTLPNLPDINTIGGFIVRLLGHLPKKGEQVVYHNLHFTVMAASSHKVDKIQIRLLDAPIEDFSSQE